MSWSDGCMRRRCTVAQASKTPEMGSVCEWPGPRLPWPSPKAFSRSKCYVRSTAPRRPSYAGTLAYCSILATAGLQRATPRPAAIRNSSGRAAGSLSFYPAASLFGDAPRKCSEAREPSAAARRCLALVAGLSFSLCLHARPPR